MSVSALLASVSRPLARLRPVAFASDIDRFGCSCALISHRRASHIGGLRNASGIGVSSALTLKIQMVKAAAALTAPRHRQVRGVRNCSSKMRRRFAHAWLIACASAAKPTTLQMATYNILNPVHKSVGGGRESDIDELWLARGRRQAAFVADALGAADVICFQEWFFEPRWLSSSRRRSRRINYARRGVEASTRTTDPSAATVSRSSRSFHLEAVVAPVFDDGRSGLVATLQRRGDRPVVVATCHLPFADAAAGRRRRRPAPPPPSGKPAATTRR